MPDDPNAQPPTPPEDAVIDTGIGAVVDLEIIDELKDSYLTYAMSTIMDRALPDVRDGLKPSQRRILVAMHDLNLRPGRKHLKCAKICGDTSGNYHPHGESVIYPTLVGLAQPWKMSVRLVDPQGNFGSIDGDPPAAMRYTEARMHHAAVDMLEDIKLDTVDFQANYDDRLQEPAVLPGKFPHLLINGGIGIAVGMATSLLPHNPTEVFDAIIRVLDEPDVEIKELMEIVPGPDFPTGGVIRGRRGIAEGYATGRGRLKVQGKVHVEDLKNNKQQIVIDQIPYQLIQETLVSRIVTAVGDGRIKDIVDVRNESGRSAQTRVVCELRRGADPAVVENQLYQFTPLRSTISMMNIALVNRQPRTLSLKEIIDHYIAHRVDVIERRTRHLLHEAKKRAHVLEGLIYAVCDIDEVIRIIRGSRTREEAINALAARRFRIPPSHEHAPKIPERLMRIAGTDEGALLTRVQAEAIGAMRLIQLVGLEIEKLTADYRAIVEQIEDYEDILARPERVISMIREDCVEMRSRYGRERRTVIEEDDGDIDIAELIREEDVAVTITHEGWVKRTPVSVYREQGRGGSGVRGAAESREGDFIEHVFVASTHDDLLCFTSNGRVFKVKVYEVPEGTRTSKGRSIRNLIEMKPGERAVKFMPIHDFERTEDFLVFATASGKVKRTSLKLYQNVNRSGLIAIDVRDGDELVGVTYTDGDDHLILVTASGMSIRFKESDARAMGRGAAGVKGINLASDDTVVSLVRVPMASEDDTYAEDPELALLTLTEHGYGKCTNLREYLVASGEGDDVTHRPQSRGGKGRIDIRTTTRNGRVVVAHALAQGEGVVLVTEKGQLTRIPGDSISRIGRATQGVRIVRLKSGDRLVAAAIVPPGQESDVKEEAPAETE
ncbi:MAG: DNA gyrase subunit A [Planctomycetota bacterium]